MKKTIFFILAMMCFVASWAYDFSAVCSSGQTLYYNINSDGTSVTVTSPSSTSPYYSSGTTKPSGSLVIPSTVTNAGNTYSVTDIGVRAFYCCTGLTSVTIPNSVTTIDNYAFCSCSHLNSITIPNSVTTINSYALYNCFSLTSITIPNSVTTIGNFSLGGCARLDTIICMGSIPPVALSNAFSRVSDSALIIIPCGSMSSYQSAWSYFSNFVDRPTYSISLTSMNETEGSVSLVAEATCSTPATIIATPNLGYLFDHWSDGNTDNPRSLTLAQDTSLTAYFDAVDFVFEDSDHTQLLRYVGADSVVVIPSTTTYIRDSAFASLTHVTSVTIPNSVTTIGRIAFYECTSLTSVTIPSSVTFIDGYAFGHCFSLASITIPNSVTEIAYGAFAVCSSLTSVAIPNSVTTLGMSAFAGCDGLTNISLPDSITTIDDEVFFDCSGLTSITIPNTVTSIGGYAFYGCTSLDTIICKSSVAPSFQSSSFENVPATASVIIPCGSLSSYQSSWRHFTNFVTKPAYSLALVSNNEAEGSVSLVTEATCSTSATIMATPNQGYLFDHWGDGITDNPRNLTLTQDTSLTAYFAVIPFIFEDSAHTRLLRYAGADSVVVIPSSTTAILDSAFAFRSHVTSVTIPNSVTSIGNYAFRNCSRLTSIIIPSSVTTIGTSAFGYCSNLASVTIPDAVTSISNNAFLGCSALASVTIGNSVTSIGSYAFSNCRALTSITIPNSVTSIGTHAFQNCSGLTSVTLSDAVTSIGTYAFYYCSGLTSITLPNSVTSLGDYAFYKCSGLTNVNIPNSITSIGNSVFRECSSLTSVTIPNNVTSIGSYTFQHCSSLTRVTIPSSVTSIGTYAFASCQHLDTIICKASVAPSVVSSTFLGDNPSITVIIPCGSLSSYQSGWNRFSNFVTAQLYSISVTSENEAQGTVTFTTDDTCATTVVVEATPSAGYEFLRWSDGATDNPYTFALTQDVSLTAYFAIVVHDTVFVHDTTILHDTVFVHDTTVVMDTVSHRLTVAADDPALGATIGSARFVNNADIQIYAIAKSAAAPFLRWNDGDTNNPRVVSVHSDTTFTAVFTPEVPDVPADPCTITTFPYFENFDTYTTSTTAKTMVQPPCWTLVHQEVAMTDAYKPMIYYASNRAHSSSYSLILNKRGYYAMPAVGVDVRNLQLTMYLCQNMSKYQLQVGVLTDPNDYTTFTRVATINNSATTSVQVSVDFSTYTGTGRYICFRNVLASGTSGDYSCNYIDDLTLTLAAPAPEPVSYTLTAVANNATMGSVTGSGTYVEGTTATLTATANSGYQFDRWSDGTNINPRIVTVTGNATYTAIFSERTSEPTDPCTIASFPYFENFDTYTTSTTAKTMVQPPCWKLIHQDVSMTDAYKPMIYYASARAHSSNYSLILNKRGYYAMPAVDVDVRNIRLSMYLCQQMTKYQLQVGVLTDPNDYTTFTRVATINNSATTPVQVTVDFSSYTGTGRYICFRNTLQSGVTGDYSCNYIDDLTLTLATATAMSESDAITAEPVSEAAVEEMAQEDDILSMMPTEDHGELNVYPNPSSGMVTLDADEIESTEVYDNTGRRVATYTDQRSLDLSALPTGMYTLRITLPDIVEIRRVVKK